NVRHSICESLYLGSALVVRRNLRVDVHYDRFREGILVNRFRAKIAPVAGLSDAAKWRSRADTLVRIDPDHSGLNRIRNTMAAPQITGPQSASESVLCGVRNPDHFLLILEARYRNERPEDLFLAYPIFRLCRYHRRLNITAGLKRRIGGR